MSLATVSSKQRFTRANPCRVCLGYAGMPHGEGKRCAGFMSEDGEFNHCTREEYAGDLTQTNGAPPTFAHRMHGPCGCGQQHGAATITPITYAPSATPRKTPPELGTVVAEYPYYNSGGELIYKVVRYDPKTFRPWRPNGKGGWTMELGNTKRVLYRLLDILKYPDTTVYVVEGEKDVDTLRRHGFTATSSQGGAEKWNLTPDAPEVLRGRNVVILPDNDDPGEKHAQQVLASLKGFARSIKVVHTPPEQGKDVSDFFANGGTLPELVTLVEDAPICWPIHRYRLLSDLDVQNLPPLRWLVDRVLPESCLSAIFGESWTGKSFVALDLAIRIALGMEWRGHPSVQGPTVYIAAEGGRGLSYRLQAWKLGHGMDPHQSIPISIIDEAIPLLQPESLGELLATLHFMPEPPKLVIIDTLGRSMLGGEENSNDDMNAVCNAGARIQREIGCNVMFVHHKGKNSTTMRGGSAFFAGIDTAFEVEKEETSPLINITCRKQKDGAEPFPLTVMRLNVVTVDPVNHFTSCYVVPVEEHERIDTFSANTHKLLTTLIERFPSGVLSGDWEKAVNLPRETYVRARQPLIDQGYIGGGLARGSKYAPTSKGRDWYRSVHGTYHSPGFGGEE